jgi:16S rRNA (cytosine967-C5)-methyltransferase
VTVPVSPARLAAFNILLRVERESAYAVELLHSGLLDDLSPIDRNLTTEIVMGVLRWRSALDETVAHFSFTPFRKLDFEVLTALRMGVYQKQFLTKVPAHAAVNETVELVKQARKVSAAGLVNAVMRKVKAAAYDPHASNLTGVPYLSSALAHPRWLVERWVQLFRYDVAQQICEYDQRIPATALRLSSPEDEALLAAQGIQLAPGALMTGARVVIAGDVTSTELFREGKIAIQDEGSQLIAALVGAGRRILDCCAAPGGKTSAIATRLPESQIVATELHAHRATLLRRLTPQKNVEVVTADALALPYGPDFDRVLADVPCSGTGTLARNPEIRWKLKPEDLHDLQSRQIAILRAAMRYVAPGGRLVYSTCSLEPEENEHVIAALLEGATQEAASSATQAASNFKIVPVKTELLRLQQSGDLVWPNIDQLISDDYLRTLPGVHPCDGFFAAILEKN